MKPKMPLGLRDGRQQVRVVKINGTSRPVLGTTQPEEENRRVRVVRQWGMQAVSPRQTSLAGIDEPLSQRSQTILSHNLAPALRQLVNTGVGSSADAQRSRQPEPAQSIPLQQTGADDS